MALIAFQFGLKDPLDWGDDVAEHLALQTRLWNRLVEIEREYLQRRQAILDADDAVSPLASRIEEAIKRKEQLVAERTALRAEGGGKKRPATPDLDQQISAFASEVRELRLVLKAERTAAVGRRSPHLKALDSWRDEEIKTARNQSGLWWSNYNIVCDTYAVARARAAKDRGELKLRRHDGTGRFTCQVQGGMTPADLFKGRFSNASLKPLAADAYSHPSRGERNRRQWSQLTITVFRRYNTDRRTLTFPIKLHRPLADDAIVKRITVSRRRLGTRFRWSVVFTCEVPNKVQRLPAGLGVAGISLAVAPHPEGLRVAACTAEDGVTEQLILPHAWLDRMGRVSEIQSRRDRAIHVAHKALLQLDASGAPPAVAALLARIQAAQRPAAAQLAALALNWREHSPSWEPVAQASLEAWRRQDRAAFEAQENLRDRLLGQRREIYRLWARGIAQKQAQLVFCHAAPNAEDQVAGELRKLASLHVLQLEIQQQAAKAGASVRDCVSPALCPCCAARETGGMLRLQESPLCGVVAETATALPTLQSDELASQPSPRLRPKAASRR